MEANATTKFLRSTARKARLVADAVRGHKVGDALIVLEQGNSRRVSLDIAKLLKSAVANMQSRSPEANVNVDGLKIKQIKVDNGPTMKRIRARAQGRAGRILKRMCHITVTVTN